MNKSFRDRLAALEALEAEREARQADALATAAVTFSATDADALSDDEVLDEAVYGLTMRSIRFNPFVPADRRNTLRTCADTESFCPNLDFWKRICERADPLRAARGILLIPASVDELRTIIGMLDAGELLVVSRSEGYAVPFLSPKHNVRLAAPNDPRRPIMMACDLVLNAIQIQTGGDYCESNDSARRLLANIASEL